MEFPEAFWDAEADYFGAALPGGAAGRGRCFMFWNLQRCAGAPVLAALAAGAAAHEAEAASDAELGAAALAVLRRVFGEGAVPEPRCVLATRWGSEEYSRGARQPPSLWCPHRMLCGRAGLVLWRLGPTAASAACVGHTCRGRSRAQTSSAGLVRADGRALGAGSYSYVAVGASGRTYDQLAAPVRRRLLFAGEHTCKVRSSSCGLSAGWRSKCSAGHPAVVVCEEGGSDAYRARRNQQSWSGSNNRFTGRAARGRRSTQTRWAAPC